MKNDRNPQANEVPQSDNDRDDDVEQVSLIAAKQAALKQNQGGTVRRWFFRFSQATSKAVGTPWAFIAAIALVFGWTFSRPLFKTSDTWQLVINTSTTILTFLMVFLIQNTQNRDAKAIHLKLDELIRAKKGARNSMVDLEDCTDEELDLIDKEFKRIRSRAAKRDETADAATEEDAPARRS